MKKTNNKFENQSRKNGNNRQLIAIFSFSILIIVAITTIDWTVTNYYNLALLGGESLDEIMWWFFSYQITIFIIAGGLILLFFAIIQINYISKELNISIEGIHYFKFLKQLPKEKKLEIILPSLAFGLLFVSNFEDILWFRLFYGPRMSYRIDNLFESMWWLDYHPGGWIGMLMGFGGAISLSVMIAASIGYTIFCFIWYKLIQEKWLVIHLVICILFIYNIDIVFGILEPPFPYMRITLMEILYFTTFFFIVIKNTH